MKNCFPPPASTHLDTGCLFLDREGLWFHEGVQITHERTCALFSRSLYRDRDGDYYLLVGTERARVEIEDTPYLIRFVTVLEDEAGRPQEYLLHVNDGTEESLDPHTLRVGDNHALYCLLKNANARGRFLRPAYYQICSRIDFDEEQRCFWLPLNSGRFRIPHPGDDSGEG